MKKIKCSPWSTCCEIANRWTIDLACCRHADEECFGDDGMCCAHCIQSGCGGKACSFMERDSIKPVGNNGHVRRLMKDCTSCLLDDYPAPVGRVFIEFLKHLISIQILSILDIQTKPLWLKINLGSWKLLGRVTFLIIVVVAVTNSVSVTLCLAVWGLDLLLQRHSWRAACFLGSLESPRACLVVSWAWTSL